MLGGEKLGDGGHDFSPWLNGLAASVRGTRRVFLDLRQGMIAAFFWNMAAVPA
jgi:hypothetical protein